VKPYVSGDPSKLVIYMNLFGMALDGGESYFISCISILPRKGEIVQCGDTKYKVDQIIHEINDNKVVVLAIQT